MIAKLEVSQGPNSQPAKRGRFVTTVHRLCNGSLPLKAETLRPLARTFSPLKASVTEHLGDGPADYHHRGCRWFYIRRAKLEKKKKETRKPEHKRHRTKKTQKQSEQKGSKQIAKPIFGLVPESSHTQPKIRKKTKQRKKQSNTQRARKKKGSIHTDKDCPCHCFIPATEKNERRLNNWHPQ